MFKYLLVFLLLTILGYAYDKYKLRINKEKQLEHNDIVRKYLLNDDALRGSKPIIWIHMDYETNARHWENFGSRNNQEINQPYKLLTLQSIIKQAGDDFNVCIIDDDSFVKLMPKWSIDLNKLSQPVKCYMQTLGLLNLLYNYGGFLVPNNYLALKEMSGLYDTGLYNCDSFVLESLNKNVSSTYVNGLPNHRFIGCNKHSKTIKELIQYVETLNSTDYTDEQKFLGQVDRKCYELIQKNQMCLLNGDLIGCFDKNNKPILIDNLLQELYIDFSENIQGISIPDKEILKRIKYQWFARMSIEQVLTSNLIISKYLLLSLK